MVKIPKDLSDADMFKNYKEDKKEPSLFDIAKDFDKKNNAPKNMRKKDDGYIDAYLAAALNKELLKLKLDLYKEGIVDYKIKLRRDGDEIILYPSIGKKHDK